MNRTEILEEFSTCTDQTIVKGKRSKRLRPSSSSASSRSGGGEFNCNSSPASSSGISTSTLEDEDMANCLILLARGGFRTSDEETIKSTSVNKLSSRKFTVMTAARTATNGKIGGGVYDYECKTCSRTFPSFQALGGHRASHKKPKQTIVDDRKKSPPPEGKSVGVATTPPPRVSAQLILPTNKISLLKVENKLSKIHECSICGSEFGSGQALGGHMRRHRSVTNSSTTVRPSAPHDEETKNMLALNLDLNLPAPPEDDFRGHFPSNKQPCIVFSAVALVDCHY